MSELRGILTEDSNDTLTLTIRLHDPKELLDAKKAAQWATVKVRRGDLGLGKEEFLKKYVEAGLGEMIRNLTGV